MIKYNNLEIQIDDDYLVLRKSNNQWKENPLDSHTICFYSKKRGYETVLFNEAKEIKEEFFENPLFVGIKKTYGKFENYKNFSFSISAAIEKNRDSFLLSVEPVNDIDNNLRSINWPSPFDFSRINNKDYAVLNICQGAMFINGSDLEISLRDRWDLESKYNFTRANYMPWYGLIRGKETLYAQYLDPFDTGFDCEKKKNSFSKVYHVIHSQLGKLGYSRRLRIKLFENADYNYLAKYYRKYLIESGKFVSLKEKIIKNSNLEKLIGSCLVTTDIYHKYSPKCFDVVHRNILEQEKVVSFEERGKQIKRLKQLGLNKAYLHLDGWNRQGYDNQHPDVFPPCKKAGGIEAMKNLVDVVHSCGFEFGIHDQYRDMYYDSPSYTKEFSIIKYDGEPYYCDLWEGGPHEALNPMFSLDFVNRNFNLLKENDINIDGAYLDVFSVYSLDESYSENYPLTRKKCSEFRSECFENIRNRGLLIQSEEGTSWAIPHLDFTHHMPYWMMTSEDENQMIGKMEDLAIGIPIPLSTLVFHDSIITPWTNDNEKWKSCSNAPLMALIHGGIPYVNINDDEKRINLCKKAMEFNKLVAFDELVKHEYLDDDFDIHHSVFSSGFEVIVDTKNSTFEVLINSKKIEL